MKLKHLIASGLAAALLTLPAGALAAPGGNGAAKHASKTTPGPKASSKAKGKAYGRYCKDQLKTHVSGEKGTPFSQCVTAMAKVATSAAATPKSACKPLSHKHVKGEKGTPFSRCIVSAAQLEDDQSGDDSTSTTGDDSTSAPSGDTPSSTSDTSTTA